MELIIKGLKFHFAKKLNKITIPNSLSLIPNNIRVCTVRYEIKGNYNIYALHQYFLIHIEINIVKI